MKTASLLIMLFMLQACAVARVNTETVAPDSAIAARLPLDATILIHLPEAESGKKIVIGLANGRAYIHATGEDLKKASLEIARKYFTGVDSYSLDKDTHYLLKLSGEASLDRVWGLYKATVHAKLYTRDGSLIAERTATDSTASALLVDRNAFYNSYVNAMKEVFDAMLGQEGLNNSAFTRPGAPQRVAFRDALQDTGLELVSTGSGFFINESGDVLTNYHVIQECLAVTLSRDGQESSASVSLVDRENDVAVLKSAMVPEAYASFEEDDKSIRMGEDVITIGYPLHGLLAKNASLATGILSALAGFNDDQKAIQVTAPTQPGNSGGPVINRKGLVIGVIQSTLDVLRLARYTGSIAQNVNFAVNAQTVKHVLEKNSVRFHVGSSKAKPEMRIPDIADQAAKYAVQVMCRG